VAEAPYAFGGTETLAEERARPDEHWQTFAAEHAGDVPEWRDRCVGYLAFDNAAACGKALCFLSPKTPGLAFVAGVWIDPRFRRQGVGRQMMERAIAWARAHEARRLKLWVDRTNPLGGAFYESLGFKRTGQSRTVSENSKNLEDGFELSLPV
jgi:GNAT superfamily N-acetyltransferase